MNKRVKRILMVLTVFSIILCSLTPAVKAYAAGATANGTAAVKNATLFKDGTVTVDLSITGTQATVSKTVPNDVVIIADNSGSMDWNNKIDSLKNAVKQFTNTVKLDKHRIGIVAFASYTKTLNFSTNKSEINAFTDSMVASGGTQVGPAIDAAVDMLKNNKRDGAKPTIILLTDGEAGDRDAMLAAADRAKAEGFVFYTIALLDDLSDPDNNSYNNDMKLLSTTEAHHHFVGVDNLEELYNALADYVGVENPYNVVVKQKIADEFEYVPGSADKNIPVPTIEGNTLTWNMLEIKNTTIKLNYKIRPKDSDMEDGAYKVCSTSYLTYEDYAGNQFKKAIAIPTVTVKPYVNPTVTGMTPTSSDEGVDTYVKISYGNITYDEDFEMRLNGKAVKTIYKGSTYSKFQVTSDMAPGTYKVTIFNHGKTINVGDYVINKVVPPAVTFGKINVSSADEGVEVLEKITVSNLSKYASDFKVTIGGTEAAIPYKGTSYFKFTVPKTLKVGDYKCEAVNNGIKYDLGTFTVNEIPIPEVKFGPLTVEADDEGNTPLEKITVSSSPVYSKLTITIDGIKCPYVYKCNTYFKFTIPAELTAGTYDVIADHGGKKVVLGEYTAKSLSVPDPVFCALPVTEGEIGDVPYEKITYTNMDKYPSDFKVLLDGKPCEMIYQNNIYFKFAIPAGLNEGSYDIVVVCNGKQYALGTYTVKGEPVPEIKYGSLSVPSGKVGETPLEKIMISGPLDYKAGFNVTVDGINCNFVYQCNNYFKFNIPDGLTVGTYDVIVNYKGRDQVIGTYKVEEESVPDPVFGGLSVPSGNIGEAPLEKITCSGITTYPADFTIYFDGNETSVYYKDRNYFKFYVPENLAAGSYEVKVIYAGKEFVIGNYEVKEKVIPMFTYKTPAVQSGTTYIKVTLTSAITYGNLKAYVGGVEVPIIYSSSSYFKVNAKGCKGALTVDYFNYKGVDLGFTY